MAGALEQNELAAWELAPKARTFPDPNPAIGVAPKDHRGCVHARQAAGKCIESEFTEHAT